MKNEEQLLNNEHSQNKIFMYGVWESQSTIRQLDYKYLGVTFDKTGTDKNKYERG